MLLISPSRWRPALSIFCRSSIGCLVVLVGGVLLEDLAVADDGIERRAQLVAHVGEEAGFGPVGFVGRVARVGELGFVLFHFGDVGIDRNRAAVGGFALADLDPTTVAAALDVGFAGGVVAREPFRNPGIVAPFGILDQPASGGGAQYCLEARAGHHHLGVGCKKILVPAVADDELVVGVVQREAFGYGLDRLGKAGACLADFLEVRFLHLDRCCAKHSQRLRHAADLIGAALRKRRFEIALGQGQHALAERSEASDDIAPDVKPDDQHRADQAERDDGEQTYATELLDGLGLLGGSRDSLLRSGDQGGHCVAQLD